MTRKPFVPLAALALLAACDISTSPPPSHPYGLVIATTYAGVDSGTYAMQPEAAFYSISGGPLAFGYGCDARAYVPEGTGALAPTIDAGATLTGTIGAGATKSSFDMVKLSQSGFTSYQASTMVPVNPGTDSVSVTIPGATGGFPAWSIAGRTVAPFTFDPVPDTASTSGLTVTWHPASSDTTAMIIELRYAANGSKVLNQEIYCVAPDNGSYTVPRVYASEWNTAPGDTVVHEVVLTRFRATTRQQGDAFLQMITSLQNPLPAPTP